MAVNAKENRNGQKQQRSATIATRVTPREKAVIEARADAEYLSMSDYIRRHLMRIIESSSEEAVA